MTRRPWLLAIACLLTACPALADEGGLSLVETKSAATAKNTGSPSHPGRHPISAPSSKPPRAAGAPEQDASSRAARSSSLSPWTTVSALCVVVGLILIIARVYRGQSPAFRQALPAEAIQILGRRMIDAKQSILVIRLGSRILVLGSSPNGLQPLSEIADPVEVDLLAGMCRSNVAPNPFGAALSKMWASPAPSRTTVRRPDPSPLPANEHAQEIARRLRAEVNLRGAAGEARVAR